MNHQDASRADCTTLLIRLRSRARELGDGEFRASLSGAVIDVAAGRLDCPLAAAVVEATTGPIGRIPRRPGRRVAAALVTRFLAGRAHRRWDRIYGAAIRDCERSTGSRRCPVFPAPA